MSQTDSENAASTEARAGTRGVVFFLDDQRYALPIQHIQEIQQIVEFSAVPSGGYGVVGMVNLRGNVIPAVDMRTIIGLPRIEYRLETPMVVCRIADHLVALVVDEVQDVLELPGDCIQAAPPMHQLAGKMLGVCRMEDGLVYLLDLEKVVGPDLPGWGG